MTKKNMLIDAAHPEEVRVALLDNGKIEDFDFESAARKPLRGNIYLARVTRVEPSLQAAFVEYGGNRHGFLAFSEIHPDYYQIPVSDRKLLQQAEAEVADLAAKLELAQRGDEDDDDETLGQDDDAIAAAEDDNDLIGSHTDKADGDDIDDGTESGDFAIQDDDAREIEEEEEEEDEKEEIDGHDGATDDDADTPPLKTQDTDEDAPGGTDFDERHNESVIDEPERNREETDEAAEPEDSEKQNGFRKSRAEREELFERYKDAKRKRSSLLRNYKIQEVIKRRQILLVQAVKEERGTKGAALTTYLSLAGRYCVLMPNTARGGGISRKIPSATDRRRLRRVVDSLEVPQGMGLIIRTAGAKRTKTEIKRDYDYLLRLWENIRTLTLKSIAPCLIYEEANLIKRAIRDLYDKDISKVLVEGEAGYREAKDFMKMLMPSHAKNVQPYKDRTPIFLKYGVEEQLDGMYQPSVRLKSGGYIVIHQTEALVAIDVNSGRSTRERNIELTALKTNIEAAYEAARQFRLRDLAGLIVIDFIDMEEPKNNRKVEKALKEGLKADRARIQAGRISNFGLLELSRQRRRSGIVDGTTHVCPTCSGAGAIRSHEMAALRILRAIEGEAISGKVGRIVAYASLDVSQYILNHNRDWLKRIEDNNGVSIEITADPDKAGDAYDLEKSGVPRERTQDATVIRADQTDSIDLDDENMAESAEADSKDEQEEREGGGRKRRRRKRRRKDASSREKSEADQLSEETGDDDQPPAEEESAADSDETESEKPKRRRRRGRRGGRRNRKSEGDGDQVEISASVDSDEKDGDEGLASASQSGADTVTMDGDPANAEPRLEMSSGAAEGNSDDRSGKASSVEPERLAEEAPPAAAETETTPEAKKPGRKGWWQRATGL